MIAARLIFVVHGDADDIHRFRIIEINRGVGGGGHAQHHVDFAPQQALDHPGIVGRVAQFGIHVQLFIEEGLHALVIADLLGGVLAAENAQIELFRLRRRCLPCHHHARDHCG